MNKGLPKLAIVLPAFNESAVIARVLKGLRKTLRPYTDRFDTEIIVVNDGSTDETDRIVSLEDGVILINHLINTGPGGATRTGLHYARDLGCKYVITMDTDGQHSADDVAMLIDAISNNQADFIIGSRLKSAAGNMPFSKKVGNVGLSLVTFLLLGVYASDTQSGLKALNRKVLEKVEFHSNSYAFCSEMIWKAHQADLKIEEIPVKAIYTEYSHSRGQKNITGAIDIIKQLAKRRFLGIING